MPLWPPNIELKKNVIFNQHIITTLYSECSLLEWLACSETMFHTFLCVWACVIWWRKVAFNLLFDLSIKFRNCIYFQMIFRLWKYLCCPIVVGKNFSKQKNKNVQYYVWRDKVAVLHSLELFLHCPVDRCRLLFRLCEWQRIS